MWSPGGFCGGGLNCLRVDRVVSNLEGLAQSSGIGRLQVLGMQIYSPVPDSEGLPSPRQPESGLNTVEICPDRGHLSEFNYLATIFPRLLMFLSRPCRPLYIRALFPPRIGFSIKTVGSGVLTKNNPLILELNCQVQLNKKACDYSDRGVISFYAATLNKCVFVCATF